LTHFVEDKENAIWSQKYPYGTQTVGLLVDTFLHKAYRHLYGFLLVSDVKDIAGSVTPLVGVKKGEYPPENVAAAISLYRCIMRTYSAGRRTPPKAALDTVLDALPEVKETMQSGEIRKFLFSDMCNINLNDLVSVLKQSFPWETRFGPLIEMIKNNASCELIGDEILVVRRGISTLLAQGPIPSYQDNGDYNSTRIQSALAEEELSKKLAAVVDDLCFNNANSFEGWFKASQCLIVKADLIADRIGLLKGFSRSDNFCVPTSPIHLKSLPIRELEARQELEAIKIRESWIETLGNDLSLFVKFQWSSLKSLECLATDISRLLCDEKSPNIQSTAFGNVEALLLENDVAGWQESLGGVFVSSLRQVAYRCICMAIYIANLGDDESKNWLLISEITESLGITLYAELLGSQSYGYPMHVTPDFIRRDNARTALVCFEYAVELIKERNNNEKDARLTWDLYFMIGKVS
jgi:hypothetical protein